MNLYSYFQIYLQKTITNPKYRIVRSFVQMLLLYLAIYTGFTRISDYKHHWSDVLAGLANGVVVAIVVHLFVTRKMVDDARKVDASCRPQLESIGGYNSCQNVELGSPSGLA